MKKTFTLLVILLPFFSFSQFNPVVNVSLTNLDCDTLSGITISVSQNNGEVDIANATFQSNSGYFDITNISINDTVGTASLNSGGGLFAFNTVLIVDSMTFSEIFIESIDLSSGLSLGSFSLANSLNGVSIYAVSPSDGNNYTSGNSSTVSFNSIFHNPLAPTVSFLTEIHSELGDIDNQVFNINLSGLCAFCNTYADFGVDTVYACDSASVQISSPPVTNGSYVYTTSDNNIFSGIWHDSIFPGQNVQDLLDDGINPLDIYNAGYSLSSIYGKNYNGGIIFYLDVNTGDGLVANDFDLSQTDWGCNNSFLGGTQLGVGSGQSNTDTILASCSQAGIAAKLCDDFSSNGYYDWYLPSFNELSFMFTNLQLNGHSSFNNYYYWSSSEWDNDEAYMFHFTLGYGGFAAKNNNYDVRPVRSFSYQPYNNLTNLTISNSGWNFITVTDSLGCTASDSVYVLLESSSYGTDIQVACDSFTWIDGLTYTVSNNTATHTLVNSVGCDSVVSLDLIVNYSNSSLETTIVCDTYIWNGISYTNTGSYSSLFTNVDGCDSTAHLDLTVLYSNSGSASVTTCDSYVWEGVTYTTSGIYTNVLSNVDGCDSTATLNLTINYSDIVPSQFNDFYICDGESVTVGSNIYTLPGTYTDTLVDFNGCDSIVSTSLSVSYLDISLSSAPVTCSSYNDGSAQVIANSGMGDYDYLWNTGAITSTIDSLVMGTYSVTVNDSLCVITDSITVELNVAPADSMHPEICYATVDFSGFNRVVLKPLVNPLTASYIIYKEYSAGLYSPLDTLDASVLTYTDSSSNPSVQAERYKVAAIDDCGNVSDTSDYHKTVHLSMNTGINGEVNLAWNNYEGYQVSNYLIFRQDSTGAIVLLTSISGTNTSYTDLTPPLGSLNYQVRALAQACTPIQNSLAKTGGLIQMTNDTLESNIVNHNNISLQVTVIPTNPSCLTCNDGSIIANASGGSSPYTYSWSNGVSGFFNGNLTVGTYTVYVFDNMGDSTSATATLFFDVYGCTDSTAINYNPIANIDDGSCIYCSDNGVSINVTSCDSYLWTLNNTTYDSTGIYINVLTDSLGCTTTDTLDLTINNSSSSTVTITVCDSFDWDGMTYDSTGMYTNVYTDVNGCDSTVTLDLIINNSSSSTVTITACDSFDWDGVTYDSTGMYTNVYTDVNGCDSTVTLDLTINNSSSSTVTITACDSFNWDGMTYDSTGMYTNVYTDVNGCDSTVTLDLTINNSSSSTVTVTACDSFDWDGMTYDSTGMYTNVYNDVNGCDSTVTLDLTINDGPTDATVTQSGDTLTVTATTGTAPYTYEWNTGETTQFILPDSSGTYYCIVTDTNGCEDWSNQYTYTTTDISEIFVNSLLVYPNPTRGILNIEFDIIDNKISSLSIVNILGDIIFNENIENKTSKYSTKIDLSKYANGIYFVKMKTENKIISRKIILQ